MISPPSSSTPAGVMATLDPDAVPDPSATLDPGATTTLTIDNPNASATPTSTPKRWAPGRYGPIRSPRLLTAPRLTEMGYPLNSYMWRAIEMSPNAFRIKMEALQHKANAFKMAKYSTQQLLDYRAMLQRYIIEDHCSTPYELMERFKSQHPDQDKQNEFEKFLNTLIKPANRQQTGRGTPSNLKDFELFVNKSLDDYSFTRAADLSFTYEADEMLNALDQAIAYNDVNVEFIDGKPEKGCKITRQEPDPNDPSKTISVELASVKFSAAAQGSKMNILEFTCNDNSPEAVRHFNDLISQMRQGSSNKVTFIDLGEPIAAIAMLHELIVEKHMHVVIPPEVKKQFFDELEAALQNDPYKTDAQKYRDLAAILVGNSRTFSDKSNKYLQTYSPGYGDPGSYLGTSIAARFSGDRAIRPTVTDADAWLRTQTMPLMKETGLVVTTSTASVYGSSTSFRSVSAANASSTAGSTSPAPAGSSSGSTPPTPASGTSPPAPDDGDGGSVVIRPSS